MLTCICAQVGRLPNGEEKDGEASQQFISAEYTGHGMTRAYAWWTSSFIPENAVDSESMYVVLKQSQG